MMGHKTGKKQNKDDSDFDIPKRKFNDGILFF